jgi:hypothetical protein
MSDFANAVIDAGGVNTSLLELTKQLLEIDPLDTTRDTELSVFIDMAGDAAERYIDNILLQRPVTERFKNVYSPVALRYWPGGTVSSVLIDGVESVTDYSELYQDGLEWVLKDFNSSCKSWTQMDIVYQAGYDPLPSEVGYAIARGAISYDSEAVGSGPVRKESIVGVGSVEYDTSVASSTNVGMLPASSIAALQPYRRYHV